jgi:two-component system phosphate regulon sensor histidine kinase PhoR
MPDLQPPMSISTVLALVVLVALAAWLAWRYLAARRDLHAIRTLVERQAGGARAEASPVKDLPGAVRAVAEGLARGLADLGEQRDRLATVLDQMTEGVLIIDAGGEVQFSNLAARRIFDIPQPLGRTVTQVLRDHQLVAVWTRSRQTNELQSEAVEIPTRRQFLQMIAMPDRQAGGHLILIQDLTRLRRLETVRRDFVSNISHELRTPLASLKALTETLQGGAIQDPQAGPRFLERIGTEVDALTQMSEELLDLSRIESGQVDLDLRSISPRALLRSAADRMRLQAERAGLEFRLECPDDLPAVLVDRGRLEQVLVNLIHNAVKFTRPGGEVVLSAQVDSEIQALVSAGLKARRFIQISVRDNGRGIPADDVPRIFERFFRVERSRSGGGTGLGLSIARHIVEAHGGRIWVESLEGRGSTFFFSVPAA